MESGKNFKIIEIRYTYPKNILNFNKVKKVGYDPKLFNTSTLKRYFGSKYQLIPINKNLVDLTFLEKQRKLNQVDL